MARRTFAQCHSSKQGLIERLIERAAPNDKSKLLLYCRTEDRSVLAADNLKKMGYINVYYLKGGYQSWIRAGYPIIKEAQEGNTNKNVKP